MKKIFQIAFVALFASSFFACSNPDSGSSVAQLKQEYQTLMDSGQSTAPETQEVLSKLAAAYEKEAPDQADSAAKAEFLYLAAEIYEVSNRNVQKALELYDRVINEYPSTKRAEDALFHKGFLNNKIKNFEASKAAYEEFIKKYPNSDLVDDAQAEIKYMGLSDEELFEVIRQKADSLEAGEEVE